MHRGRIGQGRSARAEARDSAGALLRRASSPFRCFAAAQGSLESGRGPQAPRERPQPAGGQRERRSKELQADLDKIAAERERINARLVETAKLDPAERGPAQPDRVPPGRARGAGEAPAPDRWRRAAARSRRCSAAMQRMGRNPPPVMVTQPAGRAVAWCAAACCWRRRCRSSAARPWRCPSSSAISCASRPTFARRARSCAPRRCG